MLVANSASDSDEGDGIDVAARSTILLANVANDNADWGIESAPGVFAFGNRASGNGQPAQPVNVRCRWLATGGSFLKGFHRTPPR